MKTKNNLPQRILLFIGILLHGFSCYAVNNITFSMDSCTFTSTTLSFNVYVSNTSPAGDPSPMLLTALSIGVNYSETIENSGTQTVALVPGSWDQSVPNLDHIYNGNIQLFVINTSAGGSGNDQMQIQIGNINVSCSSTGGNAAPVLPLNTPVKVGRFTLTNSSPWRVNSLPLLTFNTSSVPQNRNTGANICNAGTAVAANTATTRFVLSGCGMILNPDPNPVPTVSEWGLLIMGGLMCFVVLFANRKSS
jgi:hypothetical protein